MLTTNGITYNSTPLAPYHIKVNVEGNKITVYGNDSLMHTETLTTTQCGLIGYMDRGVLVKNFKIKPL